jgi:hypothetical protein
MLSDVKQRIFGRSARGTVIRLVVASIAVGAILSVLSIDPAEFWRGVWNGLKTIVSLLGDTIGEILLNILTYFVLGAIVVVPIWLIARLLAGGGARKAKPDRRGE